jgi:hypothetical protein
MNIKTQTISWIAVLTLAATALTPAGPALPDPLTMPEIKSYCLDFNWEGKGRKKRIATPGFMKGADPKAIVEWHKSIGCNVIQTFCVSTNGYAYYRNDVTPEQPGLQYDLLRDLVKLGHAEGMLVMGYFCAGANNRWGTDNPHLSYGVGGYHLPYTNEYLAYLSAAITDAVKTTGIDGFMVDWIWQPSRKANDNKWIEAEKKLYQQLMGEPFPGEDKLTAQQDLAYSRKAIDRCWKTIRKAAKDANPKCIVWLTCNNIKHPHIKDSDMFREVDWLMAETGNNKHLEEIRNAVGKHTRLITCLADWNNADPGAVIPDAQAKGIGLYGFCAPASKDGTIPLKGFITRQVTELRSDDRNISALARAYHGKSLDADWNGRTFAEPATPYALRLGFATNRRGLSATGRRTTEGDTTLVTIETPYHNGEGTLTRIQPQWTAVRIRLQRSKMAPDTNAIRITSGTLACEFPLQKDAPITWGATEGITTGKGWKFTAKEGEGRPSEMKALVEKTPAFVEFSIPKTLIENNPQVIAYEWLNE